VGSPAYHYSRHAAAAAERGVAGRPDVLASAQHRARHTYHLSNSVLSATYSLRGNTEAGFYPPTPTNHALHAPTYRLSLALKDPCSAQYTHAPTPSPKQNIYSRVDVHTYIPTNPLDAPPPSRVISCHVIRCHEREKKTKSPRPIFTRLVTPFVVVVVIVCCCAVPAPHPLAPSAGLALPCFVFGSTLGSRASPRLASLRLSSPGSGPRGPSRSFLGRRGACYGFGCWLGSDAGWAGVLCCVVVDSVRPE
jgi:hypothetical protein